MSYYYDGVKCDTLAELNALRKSLGAQPMAAAHSSNRGESLVEHIYGHSSTCDCNRCDDLATRHAHSSFAG